MTFHVSLDGAALQMVLVKGIFSLETREINAIHTDHAGTSGITTPTFIIRNPNAVLTAVEDADGFYVIEPR